MASAGISDLFPFGFSNLNGNLVKLFSYGLKNCICVVGLLMDLFKVIKFDSRIENSIERNRLCINLY